MWNKKIINQNINFCYWLLTLKREFKIIYFYKIFYINIQPINNIKIYIKNNYFPEA